MKKIYTLMAGFLLVGGAVNAQIVKDGGFQGTYVSGAQIGVTTTNNYGGTTTDLSTLDWQGIMKQETTNAITAGKSAWIESIEDAAAATIIGSTEPKTSGLAQQILKTGALAGKTPSDFSFSFKYTYAPAGVDTAFVLVNLMDSTLTGQAAIKYQGIGIMLTQATAATKTVTWLSNNTTTGTINRIVLTFGSSMSNFFEDVPANVGSKLVVDDVALSLAVGIDEATAATSNVYPNPVANMLNVEISNAEATSISIYSLDGTLVKTENLNGAKGSVNVENLRTGMYLYTISTKGGSVIQSKFLKN